ncbi:MAG: nicotinamide-nucleotide amidohydrolase family protein [Planctomycetota bacterium]
MPAGDAARRAAILVTGDELIEGRVADRNGPLLARRLGERGYSVDRIVCVGDDLATLVDAIRALAAAHDLVVMSGGLGGTLDDLTREAAARAIDVPLVEMPEGRAVMARFWERLQRTPPDREWVEALLPRGARVLDNPTGLAPGFEIAIGAARLQAYPGVPAELETMSGLHLPRGGAGVRLEREVLVAGRAESDVAARLGDRLDRGRDPLIGIAAKEGFVALRIRTVAATVEEGEARIATELAFLEEALGEAIVSVRGESVDALVARVLLARGETLAVAESLTGGLIGHRLTEHPGISAALLGVDVTYANAAKEGVLGVAAATLAAHGAVSEEVAREMAEGVRRLHDADWGIATTGIAGPDGGSARKPVGLAWVACAHRDGVTAAESRVHPGSRSQVKERASCHALDLLRREIARGDGTRGAVDGG